MRARDFVKRNIAYHQQLNPVAWRGNDLRPEVREHLLKIAEIFEHYLEIPNFEVQDIVLTGSMANYNYTQYSDFDLHVVTNYNDLQCDDVAEALYRAKKDIWNNQHDISIRGHEVELYIEDTATPPVSGGVYSLLNDAWIKEPEYNPPTINNTAVNAKVTDLIKQITVAIATADDPADLKRIRDRLRIMRRSGLDREGEFGVENLAFKILRNQGYLDQLNQAYLNQQDSALSLKESKQDYMRGHCHVMALALKRIHPDWQLRAHIGWDEDAEDDDDYRVDHVYAVAPDGAAYDCRGRFDSEQQLVGPNEVGVEDTQFVDMDWAEIKRLIWRGELKPFDMQDVERATAVAKQMQLNEQAVAPVTVYHGNQGGIHRELITPMWWTEDRDTAEYYATQGGADGYVYSATLTCKNPYVIVKGKDEPNDMLQKYASLIEQGYDSIHDPRLGDWIPFHARDIHVTGREDVDGDEEITESTMDWKEIEEFIGELTPDDVGVEEFGEYRVHFEGFTDDCQTSSDYQEDPEKVFQQVFADFVARENGGQPIKQGITGSDDYPILYSIFRISQSNTVNEVVIDNNSGAGVVPHNMEVDYFGLRVKMRPSVFLKLAAPLNDFHRSTIMRYIADGGAIASPFLTVDIPDAWSQGDFSEPAQVSQHEGRNRMTAVLQLEGDDAVEVHIFPRYYRNRDMTDKFIENLNRHLRVEDSARVLSGPLFTM